MDRSRQFLVEIASQFGAQCLEKYSYVFFSHFSDLKHYNLVAFCFITADAEESTANVEMNYNNDHGGSAFNGNSRVLYWADAFSEIAFVVPSSNTTSEASVSTRTLQHVAIVNKFM